MKKFLIAIGLLILITIAEGQNMPFPLLPVLPPDSIAPTDVQPIYHNYSFYSVSKGAMDSNPNKTIISSKVTTDTLIVNNKASFNGIVKVPGALHTPVIAPLGLDSSGNVTQDSCGINCGNINGYAWLTGGNSGINTGINAIGTTDRRGLRIITNNTNQIVFDSANNITIGSGTFSNGWNGYIFYGANPTGYNNAITLGTFTPSGNISSVFQSGYLPGIDDRFPTDIPTTIISSSDSTGATALFIHNSFGVGLQWQSASFNGSRVVTTSTGVSLEAEYAINGHSDKILIDTNAITFYANDTISLSLDKRGNLKYPRNNPVAGNVLTSDASGNATWQTPIASGATGSEPGTPYLGQFYFDTTLVKMKFWNGAAWAVITSTP